MSSHLSSSGTAGEDARAFLQRRIGLVATAYAALVLLAWSVSVVQYLIQGRPEPAFTGGSLYALGSGACMGIVALALRLRPFPRTTLLIIESTGIVGASVLMAFSMFTIELGARPELMLITALTYFLVLRSALVPSRVLHTVITCVLIGIPMVAATYVHYARDTEFLATASPDRMPGAAAAWAAQWCLYTTLVSSILARIVHGLRKDVRAAQRLGQYVLDEKLGTGGMGEVWRATHRLLRRPAAIKLIRPEALGGRGADVPALQARFEREAQTTASLQSPHIVELYDFGVSQEGIFYHVIEFLDGWDLESLIQRHGPMRWQRAVFLLRQACDALDDAHRADLIHRDIKPANIFLTRKGRRHDFIKVLDFGLVKTMNDAVAEDVKLTSEDTLHGTPAYLAPELATGRHAIDGRADLYALGCVAHWLLTGQVVFEGKSPMEVAAAHITQAPQPPSERTETEIPTSIDDVVLACLAKDPADRPRDALTLARMLDECARSEPWSEAKAEEWWSLHAPAPARPARASHETQKILRPM